MEGNEMGDAMGHFGQRGYRVRLDWGPVGAQVVAADISVVVDVLSFSTSVCIAVERGMRVYPYLWKGVQAEEFARQNDAVLAVGRLEASKVGATPAPSLSPAGLLACEPVPRLVLPSPNGSTIAATLSGSSSVVVAGCLRNAGAVGDWLATRLVHGDSVSVIAAGERWGGDDSLRPALEDHLGAGAILSAVASRCMTAMSPEAAAAVDLFEASSRSLPERVRNCVGGRELASMGFLADVQAASTLNASETVPLLADGLFSDAERN